VSLLYPAFLLITALEMLWEASISARNSAQLVQRGAIEIQPRVFPLMVLLYVLLYTGSLLEFWFVRRQTSAIWMLLFAALFLIAKGIKFWAVSSLGSFWTMKVLIVPGSKTVSTGPYKWIRHPNYIAVLMEITAIALFGKSFVSFAVVFLSFCLILFFRISAEESALRKYTDYRS